MDKETVNKIDDAISDCIQEIDSILMEKNIFISAEGLQEEVQNVVWDIIE